MNREQMEQADRIEGVLAGKRIGARATLCKGAKSDVYSVYTTPTSDLRASQDEIRLSLGGIVKVFRNTVVVKK